MNLEARASGILPAAGGLFVREPSMNPFSHPTVATPQPNARWGSPSHHPSHHPSHRSAKSRHAPQPDTPIHAAPGQGDQASEGVSQSARAGARPATRSASGMRRAGRFLGVAALAGSLLVPGLGAAAVDINTATAQELQQVKGIGPKMAQVMIDERERGGRFASMADVSERVKGVGAKKAATFEAAGLLVGGTAALAPDAKAAPNGSGKKSRNR